MTSKFQSSCVVMLWRCKGLAKYGRSGCEHRAAANGARRSAVKCDECDWWHIIPKRIKLQRHA